MINTSTTPICTIISQTLEETTGPCSSTLGSTQQPLFSPEQHRKIFDCFLQCIVNNHHQRTQPFYQTMNPQNNQNSVTFTFPPQQQQMYRQQIPWCQQPQSEIYNNNNQRFAFLTSENRSCCPACIGNNDLRFNQTNFDQLAQSSLSDLIYLQKQLGAGSCYPLRFHLDHWTSTSDLYDSVEQQKAQVKQKIADNLLGKWPAWLQTPPSRLNPRQLILKPGDLHQEPGEFIKKLLDACVQDSTAITKEDQSAKKVTFDLPQDEGSQAHVCCGCCSCDEEGEDHKQASKDEESNISNNSNRGFDSITIKLNSSDYRRRKKSKPRDDENRPN